jgi:uncharacterized protein (DUF952 family)
MNVILHIAHSTAWQRAQALGVYRGDTLETEGFIHCSLPAQVIPVANARFKGCTNLALLCIDEEKVAAEVRYEDCYESGIAFPHIYGPLNLDAVRAVVAFPPSADGTFTLPKIEVP